MRTLQEYAPTLLQKRYAAKPGETPDQIWKRVAKAVGMRDQKFTKELHRLMVEKIFLPNSPCIRNAGTKRSMLHACFILPVRDSIESIFDSLKNMAHIFHYGGGVGINFSPLRPVDSVISTGGSSSGVVSFMDIYDKCIDVVKQGGFRRGAAMGILWYNHPEIVSFIRAKETRGRLTNFNLSILVDNAFFEAVTNGHSIDLVHAGNTYGKIDARLLMDLICEASWGVGDPAMLFFDRINKDNPLYPKVVLDTTNPCSEVALPAYGACCLGSVNLAAMVKPCGGLDVDGLKDASRIAARALLNMNSLSWYPLPEIDETMRKLNPIGVGVMGFADMLIKMGIEYGSKSCFDVIDLVSSYMMSAVEEITMEEEVSPFYNMIIAPTGTLSIFAGCSSGIEPVFAKVQTRLIDGEQFLDTKEMYDSECFVSASDLDWRKHLAVQARWQAKIDGGISKTINLPESATIDDIKKIYKTAWANGTKGVTVFRENCKPGILTTVKCDDQGCYL